MQERTGNIGREMEILKKYSEENSLNQKHTVNRNEDYLSWAHQEIRND